MHASKRVYGLLLAVGMATTVIGLTLIAEFRAPHPECSWQFPKIIACALAAHENLAGGLIGASGTIFAGWLAWSAIQEQIALERSLATWREDESKHAVVSDLRAALEQINQLWRAVDLALQPDQPPEQREDLVGRTVVVAGTLPQASFVDSFVERLKDLGPLTRARLAPALGEMSWLLQRTEALTRTPQDQQADFLASKVLRVHLSRLHHRLTAFDENLASIFDGRTKEPLDNRSLAEHIRPFIDQA
jgi:hypothetical protein